MYFKCEPIWSIRLFCVNAKYHLEWTPFFSLTQLIGIQFFITFIYTAT